MAETDNTPEGVAYALYRNVLQAEGKLDGNNIRSSVTREDILTIYGQCIRTVRSGAIRPAGKPAPENA